MCLRRLPHLFAGFCTLWKLETPDIQGFLAMCHYYDTFPTATIIDTGICCGRRMETRVLTTLAGV